MAYKERFTNGDVIPNRRKAAARNLLLAARVSNVQL
jgi:hypothetical protein